MAIAHQFALINLAEYADARHHYRVAMVLSTYLVYLKTIYHFLSKFYHWFQELLIMSLCTYQFCDMAGSKRALQLMNTVARKAGNAQLQANANSIISELGLKIGGGASSLKKNVMFSLDYSGSMVTRFTKLFVNNSATNQLVITVLFSIIAHLCICVCVSFPIFNKKRLVGESDERWQICLKYLISTSTKKMELALCVSTFRQK